MRLRSLRRIIRERDRGWRSRYRVNGSTVVWSRRSSCLAWYYSIKDLELAAGVQLCVVLPFARRPMWLS
jgi:hypothetical protein